MDHKPETTLARQRPDALAASELKWTASQRELEQEGVLPYHRPVPSAVGGARYVTEVWVDHDMEDAFREALAEQGGVVVKERRAMGTTGVTYDMSYYTISLVRVSDLFEVGRCMVLHYYANRIA